jgi:hypothetical protein
MFWAGAAGCVVLAGIAIWADRRRQQRIDLDRVGWAPWSPVLILALLAAAVLAALALRSD